MQPSNREPRLATRRPLAAAAALAACAVLAACSSEGPEPAGKPDPNAGSACANLVPPPESQFPTGFDYPQSASKIQSWLTDGGGSSMRNHAYCLFAGLNHVAPTVKVPVWRTWATSTQAFPFQYNPWKSSATAAGTPGAPGEATAESVTRPVTLNAKNFANAEIGGVGAINNPAPVYGVNAAVANNPRYKSCLSPISGPVPNLYALKDGVHFQSNGDIMVAAVSYNAAALKNIASQGLANAAVLDRLLPASPSDPATTVKDFPASSIVLKVMLWPVSGGGSTWSEVTTLPVWSWEANKPGSPADGQYAGYEMQNLWTDAVAISSSRSSSPGPQRTTYLYGVRDSNFQPIGPNTYDGQVVGLERFYNKKYLQPDLDALSDCDRAILDASAYWNYNRAFQSGDSLVMIAMHMMTKEQDDWTFQSAWWHPDALQCADNYRFCRDRPASVPGGDTTYQNYMMTTTYGKTQNPGADNYYAPPGTVRPVWPVAYNPYIELAASHPITTNCMNCHHRAAWPPVLEQHKPDRGRSSTYLQKSPANPNPLEIFKTAGPPDPIFGGLTMVDSMWAVSDRAGYPLTEGAPSSPP